MEGVGESRESSDHDANLTPVMESWKEGKLGRKILLKQFSPGQERALWPKLSIRGVPCLAGLVHLLWLVICWEQPMGSMTSCDTVVNREL